MPLISPKFILQHDKNPNHTVRLIKEYFYWLEEQIPDHNKIKLVRYHTKLQKLPPQPKSRDEYLMGCLMLAVQPKYRSSVDWITITKQPFPQSYLSCNFFVLKQAYCNDSAFLYVPFSLYSHMKHEFLFCTSRHRHRLWLNHDIQLLTLAHISVILGRRQSWQPHIGHPGTMRQAGRQLYYCSGMAGSAEGEALTSILMRLYTAQWPSVCRRIRQKQSHSFQRAFEKNLLSTI